jgi:hypothetical protein
MDAVASGTGSIDSYTVHQGHCTRTRTNIGGARIIYRVLPGWTLFQTREEEEEEEEVE